MATVHTGADEHVIHHHDDDASATTMIAVLLIAAVLIIGFLLFAMRMFPTAVPAETGSDVNVEYPSITVPATRQINRDIDVNVQPPPTNQGSTTETY
jgi:hypothetical protein